MAFSSAVSAGSGFAIWKVRPSPRRARASGGNALMTSPLKLTLPAVGFNCPVSRLNSVVLPAPLGPMMLTISPWRRSNDTLLTATRPPKRFTTP